MARQSARKATQTKPRKTEVPDEQVSTATVAERKGKRGHDDNGSVRPADGRWNLHDPKDESKVVRTKPEGKPKR